MGLISRLKSGMGSATSSRKKPDDLRGQDSDIKQEDEEEFKLEEVDAGIENHEHHHDIQNDEDDECIEYDDDEEYGEEHNDEDDYYDDNEYYEDGNDLQEEDGEEEGDEYEFNFGEEEEAENESDGYDFDEEVSEGKQAQIETDSEPSKGRSRTRSWSGAGIMKKMPTSPFRRKDKATDQSSSRPRSWSAGSGILSKLPPMPLRRKKKQETGDNTNVEDDNNSVVSQNSETPRKGGIFGKFPPSPLRRKRSNSMNDEDSNSVVSNASSAVESNTPTTPRSRGIFGRLPSSPFRSGGKKKNNGDIPDDASVRSTESHNSATSNSSNTKRRGVFSRFPSSPLSRKSKESDTPKSTSSNGGIRRFWSKSSTPKSSTGGGGVVKRVRTFSSGSWFGRGKKANETKEEEGGEEVIEYGVSDDDDESEGYSEVDENDETRTRLTAFYIEHKPDKLADIPTILEKYRGNEVSMFRKLEKKYSSPIPSYDQSLQIISLHELEEEAKADKENGDDSHNYPTPVGQVKSLSLKLQPIPTIGLLYHDLGKAVVLELREDFLETNSAIQVALSLFKHHGKYFDGVGEQDLIDNIDRLKGDKALPPTSSPKYIPPPVPKRVSPRGDAVNSGDEPNISTPPREREETVNTDQQARSDVLSQIVGIRNDSDNPENAQDEAESDNEVDQHHEQEEEKEEYGSWDETDDPEEESESEQGGVKSSVNRLETQLAEQDEREAEDSADWMWENGRAENIEEHNELETDCSYRDRQGSELKSQWRKRLRLIDAALMEILDSERLYYNDLDTINDMVIKPLQLKLKTGAIRFTQPDQNALRNLFDLWPKLTRFHLKLNNGVWKKCTVDTGAVVELKVSWAECDQPLHHCLDELKTICVEVAHVYDDYCLQYVRALACFAKELQSNKPLSKFLQTCEGALRGGSLESFLIKPVQRLCRYPLLMNSLTEQLFLADDAQGSDNIVTRAKRRIEKIQQDLSQLVAQIDKHKLQAENLGKMMNFQNKLRFGEDEANLSLSEPHRVLLKSGSVIAKDANDNTSMPGARFVLLYNDVMLVTVARKSWVNPLNKVYDVAKVLPLKDASLEAISDYSECQELTSTTFALKVSCKNDTWILGTDSESENSAWEEGLREAVSYSSSTVNRERDTALLDQLVRRTEGAKNEQSSFVQQVTKKQKSILSRTFGSLHAKSATVIQKTYRGVMGRREHEKVKSQLLLEIKAALIIQRAFKRLRKKQYWAKQDRLERERLARMQDAREATYYDDDEDDEGEMDDSSHYDDDAAPEFEEGELGDDFASDDYDDEETLESEYV